MRRLIRAATALAALFAGGLDSRLFDLRGPLAGAWTGAELRERATALE